MKRLINFVYEYRAFFTFLLLEVMCVWLIVANNQYQSTRYFNSTNQISSTIVRFSTDMGEYFSLRDVNKELAQENAKLRTELEQRKYQLAELEGPFISEPELINKFDFLSAKVVA